MRYKPSVTPFDAERGAEDMRNMLKRGNSYYVRFNVPEDRRADVGRVFGAASGKKDDIVRTLGTRDYREALKRRDNALDTIRNEVNAKLTTADLPPLHGEYIPHWWATPEKAVEAGLHYRQQVEQASGAYEQVEGLIPGTLAEGCPTSERDHVLSVVADLVLEESERLPPTEGRWYHNTVMAVVDGTATPMGALLDRWERERDRTISKASRAMDRAAVNHFALYIAEHDAGRSGQAVADPLAYLRATGLESLPLPVLGGFTEWLLDSAELSPKTVGSRVSPLKMFWQWCIQKHIISGPNPWEGATRGLKQQTARLSTPKRREFSESELLVLLMADPDEGRRWAWGAAIRDLMPLALLTGARENELCSLTISRVVNVSGAKLLGISVTKKDAKTANAVRQIPLHPLVRPIIERRLAAAKATGEPDAPLFPDCKPGGPAMKRGYYFSKRFTEFRRALLGEESEGLVTFHSFRKCFGTFMRRASVAGVSECQLPVVQKLMGHEPKTLTESTYMEQDMQWHVYEAAILGMVDKGVPESVLEALKSGKV